MKKIHNALIISLLAIVSANAQTVLLDENFNGCALPAGWDVSINGFPDAVWYVGINQNDNNPGESIDGSCFFFIDDDATGDNTDPYVLTATSPYFDCSKNATVRLTMDVHYRDWQDAAETFDIFLEDENGLQPLAHYDNDHQTGDNIYDIEKLDRDLVFLTKSSHARLVFRYDDGGDFDWWAGFDNVKVVGEGSGTNVILEDFNQCSLPAGWESITETGDHGWEFKLSENQKAYPKSMDGTCFALFDDDILGDSAAFSNAKLKTPWFDGTEFANYTLEMDVLHRYYREILGVLVENEMGELSEVASWAETVGGEQFDQFAHIKLDLSPFRSQQMRVVFDYSDGNDWGWWTGVDNVKIWGNGVGHDLCGKARELLLGANCTADDNRTAVFSGPAPACSGKAVGSQWYRFVSPITGFVKISTRADFNEVVNVFEGDCNVLNPITCNNRDEHGFTGEATYLPVNQSFVYLIRVSGQDENYGLPRGGFCISIEQVAGFSAQPGNDICENAVPLTLDGPCIPGTNANAATDGPAPTRNGLARADIWYKFTTGAAPPTAISFETNPDFSDVIAVFTGGCANLSEAASTEFGKKLKLENPAPNTEYWMQVSGNFATVEGKVCASVKNAGTVLPANDNCPNANVLQLNSACAAASNVGATFSGLTPNCAYLPTADVWFSFTAGASGKVKILTGADFEHVAAVWSGADCSSLEQVFCKKNPLRCNGYFEVAQLVPGEKYFLQIASFSGSKGSAQGQFCIKVLDGNTPDDYQPLSLLVEDKCTGQDMAELKVTTTGGAQPIGFQGNTPGQPIASGEDWLVVATDAAGCVQSLTGTVDSCAEADCAISVSLSSAPLNCPGASDGSATVAVLGGEGTLSYLWSYQNGTTPTITNLPAGQYTVSVNDQNGCLAIATIAVNEPPAFAFLVENSTPATVGQANGSLNIAPSGGTPPYSFFWKNGAATASAEDLANAIGGDWSLVMTDANGCTGAFDYVVQEVTATGELVDSVLVNISPNPTAGRADLSIQLVENQWVAWEISDVSGKLVLWNEPELVSKKSWSVELSGAAAGVFSIKIMVGGRVEMRRLVVVR